ncbi:helix-turn-helix domain-containing protein [Acidicapsa ligni]|uniref:helix-turn-helix domain-containing protein n=1 Tax=Acidicapsa ligni TaxID=542300 RepID=UPI0021DFFA33|nr:AraC family transcriptional regulator [Acidicapsa ligni]
MDQSREVPTVWNQLAEAMYLKDSPTAEVRLSEAASFSFGRLQSSQGLLEVARPVVGERGYIIALQLKAIPFIEQFLSNKKVSSGSYPVGGVSVINLQEEPAVLLPNPFDALVLYVTQTDLDETTDAHQAPRVEQLVWPHGVVDPVVYHLGQTLLSSLEQPHHASKIFVDHVLYALNCHFAYSYGGMTRSTPKVRGGLSPWQMRRATALLDAHLDGNIALQQVAEACDLSLGHFARAFKKTFRRPPYTWLTERRIEKAKDFMMNSRLPLADIAARSGFADQSAFNRSFKRIQGMSPGIWRRRNTLGSSRQYNSGNGETSSDQEVRSLLPPFLGSGVGLFDSQLTSD